MKVRHHQKQDRVDGAGLLGKESKGDAASDVEQAKKKKEKKKRKKRNQQKKSDTVVDSSTKRKKVGKNKGTEELAISKPPASLIGGKSKTKVHALKQSRVHE